MHSGQRDHLCTPAPPFSSSLVIRGPKCNPLGSDSLIQVNVTASRPGFSQPPSSLPGHLGAPDPPTLGKSDTKLPSHPNPGTETRWRFTIWLCYRSPKTETQRGWPERKDGKAIKITLSQHRAPHLCRHNTSGPNKSLKPVSSQFPLNYAFLLQAPFQADHLKGVRPRPRLLKGKKKGTEKLCRPKGHSPTRVALASARLTSYVKTGFEPSKWTPPGAQQFLQRALLGAKKPPFLGPGHLSLPRSGALPLGFPGPPQPLPLSPLPRGSPPCASSRPAPERAQML